ncbi:MAG: isoaspartyl peptidase/L-asparaginase, partial [bacterium]
GFPEHNPVIPTRLSSFQELMEKGEFPYLPKLSRNLKNENPFPEEKLGTVGAVAREDYGIIAVATSTGGIMGKLPGRVGDSPILGAGTYASTNGGVSCTGHGEAIMKLLLAFRATEEMRWRKAEDVLSELVLWAQDQGCSCGLIGIDWRGNIAFAFNTEGMSYGFTDGKRVVVF